MMVVAVRKAALLGVFAACFVILCGVSPLRAADDYSGAWKIDHLFDTIIAHIEQDGDSLNGVLTVTGPFGKKDVYHFTGKCEAGRIEASHYSGHVFHGALQVSGKISGVLTTRTGLHVQITARRLGEAQKLALGPATVH